MEAFDAGETVVSDRARADTRFVVPADVAQQVDQVCVGGGCAPKPAGARTPARAAGKAMLTGLAAAAAAWVGGARPNRLAHAHPQEQQGRPC